MNREQGEGLVEYGIIVMVLMTMLFGIAGFGEALYSYHFVANAAREAARWASVYGSSCGTVDSSCTAVASGDVQTYVDNLVPLGIDSSKVTVSTTWPSTFGVCGTTSNAPGCTVQVQVGYTFNFTVPLVNLSPLSFSSTSQTTITH